MKRPLALTLALILMSTIVLPVLADGEDFADSPDEFVHHYNLIRTFL